MLVTHAKVFIYSPNYILFCTLTEIICFNPSFKVTVLFKGEYMII